MKTEISIETAREAKEKMITTYSALINNAAFSIVKRLG
jgi:hypothetical protein